MRIVSFFFLSFSFLRRFFLFFHGQNIVEICTAFVFSLFCPCFASLYLPQAALSFAPKEKKAAKEIIYNYELPVIRCSPRCT